MKARSEISDNSAENHARFIAHMREIEENEFKAGNKSSDPQRRVMRIANELREKCNRLTPVQRKAAQKRAHKLIEAGRKTAELPLFDSVLAAQLRAMGCSFNLTVSKHYGILLHIGAPETYWTHPERLLNLVKTVHPLASFALSDAEGCISIRLEGTI